MTKKKKTHSGASFSSCPRLPDSAALLSVSATTLSQAITLLAWEFVTGNNWNFSGHERTQLHPTSVRPASVRLEVWSGFIPIEMSCFWPQNKAFIICPVIQLPHFSFTCAKDKLGYPAKSLMCWQWGPHPNKLNKKVKHSFVTFLWLYRTPAREQVRPRFQCCTMFQFQCSNIYPFLRPRVRPHIFKTGLCTKGTFLFSVLYLFKTSAVHTTVWENDRCFTLISQRLWIWKETECMRFARQERERDGWHLRKPANHPLVLHFLGVFLNDSLTCVSKFTCWLEGPKKKKHEIDWM